MMPTSDGGRPMGALEAMRRMASTVLTVVHSSSHTCGLPVHRAAVRPVSFLYLNAEAIPDGLYTIIRLARGTYALRFSIEHGICINEQDLLWDEPRLRTGTVVLRELPSVECNKLSMGAVERSENR